MLSYSKHIKMRNKIQEKNIKKFKIIEKKLKILWIGFPVYLICRLTSSSRYSRNLVSSKSVTFETS